MDDPLERFHAEWERARPNEPFDACRVALGSVTAAGRPSVRYVLVKEAEASGFYFYTNYGSPKAQELSRVPYGALTWHWSSVGVQVRIEGSVRKASDERSDAYFAARPRESQLGAWASRQSERMSSSGALRQRLEEASEQFRGREIPRPEFWGGFVLTPAMYEFWYEGEARLHERVRYVRTDQGGWTRESLFP